MTPKRGRQSTRKGVGSLRAVVAFFDKGLTPYIPKADESPRLGRSPVAVNPRGSEAIAPPRRQCNNYRPYQRESLEATPERGRGWYKISDT